jgi:hypothetical protein
MIYNSQEMCPCCCGEGKSDLPQWQEEIIIPVTWKHGIVYGKLAYECQTSGEHWQTEDQKHMTLLSKLHAIEFDLMERSKPKLELVK